jgi:hypothetical protein
MAHNFDIDAIGPNIDASLESGIDMFELKCRVARERRGRGEGPCTR